MLHNIIKRWVYDLFYYYHPERRPVIWETVPAFSSADNNMFYVENKFTETIVVEVRIKE